MNLENVIKKNDGYCPICEKETTFHITGDWLRDQYFCFKCGSIPRHRAIIHVIQMLYPNRDEVNVHESSPGGASSVKISQMFSSLSFSQYYKDTPLGSYKDGMRCETLESITYPNESFDLFITQDVFEHVLDPYKAFSEIARVLKPGGNHIFTVPYYPNQETLVRARRSENGLEYLKPTEYHGNPIDEKGSLVVTDWGYDLPDVIKKHSGMNTTVYLIKGSYLGLDGEHLEVFVSTKSP